MSPSPPLINIHSKRSEKGSELIKYFKPQRSEVSLLSGKSLKLMLKIQQMTEWRQQIGFLNNAIKEFVILKTFFNIKGANNCFLSFMYHK